jgi:hypothetical protein
VSFAIAELITSISTANSKVVRITAVGAAIISVCPGARPARLADHGMHLDKQLRSDEIALVVAEEGGLGINVVLRVAQMLVRFQSHGGNERTHPNPCILTVVLVVRIVCTVNVRGVEICYVR